MSLIVKTAFFIDTLVYFTRSNDVHIYLFKRFHIYCIKLISGFKLINKNFNGDSLFGQNDAKILGATDFVRQFHLGRSE